MKGVLVISNHHRRSLYFEDTMKRIYDGGYKDIIIQETGSRRWGDYKGPCQQYLNANSIPYDQGMINFKQHLKYTLTHYDTILLVDNDCFISDTNHLNQYIQDFRDGGYDFACHHVSASCYTDEYKFQGCIAPVPKQEILPATVYPFFVPEPHWENAYLLIKTDMWNKLTLDDVSHGRKYIKALVREGAKLGAHRANYRSGFTHYGDEWFHVGNLMAFYYRLEKGQPFNEDSELEMSRLGYFFKMEEQYPGSVLSKLSNYNQLKDKAIVAWERLVKDTCMANWIALGEG